MTPRNVGLIVAAIAIAVSGVVLTRAGRPFGTLTLTVHKLVALAALIVVGVVAFRSSGELTNPLAWVTGLSSLAAFATGAMVSAMQAPPSAVLWIHRVGSWVAIGAAAILVTRP